MKILIAFLLIISNSNVIWSAVRSNQKYGLFSNTEKILSIGKSYHSSLGEATNINLHFLYFMSGNSWHVINSSIEYTYFKNNSHCLTLYGGWSYANIILVQIGIGSGPISARFSSNLRLLPFNKKDIFFNDTSIPLELKLKSKSLLILTPFIEQIGENNYMTGVMIGLDW